MPQGDDRQRLEVERLEQLRDWLRAHHAQGESIWLVTWKKSSGRPYLPRRQILETLLAYGWIDSVPRKLDTSRTMLLISQRRAGSSWSRLNKDIADELLRAGRMMKPGRAAVDRAKRDGSWERLDEVQRLVVPDDLAEALASVPRARELFDRFPPSSRRGILEGIQSAKRRETRARRVLETARKAGDNIKAHHPKGRDQGPKP